MGKRHVKGSPFQMAKIVEGRHSSSRHLRRAEEAKARKAPIAADELLRIGRDLGKTSSVPAIKKMIRRNKQKKG